MAKQAFDRSIRDLDARLVGEGLFWSGYRIRRSAELMKENALVFLENSHGAAIAREATDQSAYLMITETLDQLLQYFEGRIPKIARNTGGASVAKERSEHSENLLRTQFAVERKAIQIEIDIVAFDFDSADAVSMDPPENQTVAQPLPVATKGKAPNLPPWLNPFQAVAWVTYRTDEAAGNLDNWTSKAAETFYGNRPVKGSSVELTEALQAGNLTAYGSIDGGPFDVIPPVEWARLRLDALDRRYVHPYSDIRIATNDLKRVFPIGGGSRKATQRKRIGDPMLQAWWDSLRDEVRLESQQNLWVLAKAAFPDHEISRSRVRAFTRGRKPGPRQSGGKATAD
ncbi:hypothetical protein [Parasphingopyxis marina]|uniref:Uncharacterized protein n=1 Tax=Parasphingopyxis marina TaxID=2761622 RepID=A0A842HXR9_9SPHN|nr:hypothetical protein [Parasphingopyxis marina]MBC2776730.1 hypothetical protein [Parasphingopyxis marina]